jgi:PHD/YefM family antitoxin component YafN of YafNO toxin-antitoxin module
MATRTVGIREFRDNLSTYLLDSETPVAITRHGETVGYYYPARKRPTAEQLRELRESGERLQAALDEKGLTEEELVKDFEDLRANSRLVSR